jgi:hypothetical protein
MPYPLERCPCCGGGIKFTRGPQWLQPDFFSVHEGCKDETICPVCRTQAGRALAADAFGPHLLLWIGRGFYTPGEYLEESARLGVSRRISAIPKGFTVGQTWVLLAHLDAVPAVNTNVCTACSDDVAAHGPDGDCLSVCGESFRAPKPTPGIFCAFIPQRIELILKESDATPERIAKEEKRGVTVVKVPDNDPDHQGSVWDKAPEDDGQESLPGGIS